MAVASSSESVSLHLTMNELEKYYNTQTTIKEILNLNISRRNICTNIQFDYEMLKWTDNEFTENKYFELKWRRRFGGFWHNRKNMLPTQPYQPGTILDQVSNRSVSEP